MEIQAVNSAGNPTAPPPKAKSSSPSSGSKSSSVPDPKPSGDTIDLSFKGKVLAQAGKAGQTSPNKEQRRISVTDNNDVVLQVIDPNTQKVIKSVPSEAELQLKNAIRGGVSEIIK